MPNLIEEQKLILAEVGANSNKYYFIKLFDDDSVVANYGRVGVTEQTTDYRGGKLFFDKKVREKCKKGYSLLKVVGGSSSISSSVSNSSLKEIALKQIKTNKPELTKLISRLVDANIHRIVSNTSIRYNDTTGLFSGPLGIITLNAISEARLILADIKKLILRGDYASELLIKNINKYLRLIPTNTGMKIDIKKLFLDDGAIQNQATILDSLESSYQAIQKMPQSVGVSTNEEIFDVCLDILEDGVERDNIIKYYRETLNSRHVCYALKIKQIFSVDIKENSKAFDENSEKFGNIMTLFHGSKSQNCLSILKRGLIIPPASATYICGRLYGDGIYASRQSSKAANYSFGYWDGSRDSNCFLFMVKFAMGRIYIPKGYGSRYSGSEKFPVAGYDSTHAKGGISGVLNDEMIVYKTAQAKITHLIELGE